MQFLQDSIESLAKQASVRSNHSHPLSIHLIGLTQPRSQELTMYDVTSAVNKAKAMVLNQSEIETKVREATNDDKFPPSCKRLLNRQSSLPFILSNHPPNLPILRTFNFQLFNEIMPIIYQRFTEKEAREWRQIYKALVLLEYLVKNGSERVIDDARSHLSLIKVLRNFHYTDEGGKDQGINVRNRSKELAELLSDLDRVRQERRKAKANRNKYTGVGNDGSGGGGPSFTSASGSRYGGFGSDSMDGGSGGGGGGGGGGYNSRSSNFQDSSSKAAEYEEYDAGDWEDPDRRAPPPRSTSSIPSRTASVSKPTPAPPKPAPAPPKQPEVNLFDFDDDEEVQPPVPSKGFSPTMTSGGTDDDFDDFQSAPAGGFSAPAPVPTSRQNVFELLKTAPVAPAPSFNSAPAPSYSQPPLSSFAPMRPQQPQQQTSYSHAPMQPMSRPVAQTANSTPAPTTMKPASDFSDLFGEFGTAGSGAGGAAKTGSIAAAGPKLSMAEIAAKKREEALFKT
ncbi:hypothetical protein P7C70_g9244, partial [Phenoliferia sp. Uapishka_3]